MYSFNVPFMTKTLTFIIRPPQSKKEWDVVRQLLIDYQNEFDDKTCFTSFEEELANLEGLYADPRKHKLIAVEQPGNEIVGCVGMRTLAPGIAEMKRLYVKPSHRGLHLGSLLAKEIISFATKMKYHKMMLDTMHEMEDAQKLYKRLGFVVTEPYDEHDPRHVVFYEKILDQ
jgi:ribosomal protein S18 acetylase RimI-like enzyme